MPRDGTPPPHAQQRQTQAVRALSLDEPGALIGPNAVLQLLPVLEDALGRDAAHGLLRRAEVPVPAGARMIPQAHAARAHQALRRALGPRAPGLAAQAGRGTGAYILAHRIPRPAQTLLRTLPPRPAARLLSRAIAQHAWTFVGSGRLEVARPTHFVLHDNPVIAGERSDAPLCHWHAAVFETLFRALVAPGARCRESACAATGDAACTFHVTF